MEKINYNMIRYIIEKKRWVGQTVDYYVFTQEGYVQEFAPVN